MALVARGKRWYADTQADLRQEIARYSKANTYVATHFADAVCRAPAPAPATAKKTATKPKKAPAAKAAPAKKKKAPLTPPTPLAPGECGSRLFQLKLDEDSGVAVRICAACNTEHAMGDSAAYLDEAEPLERECACENSALEVTVGVSLYADSEDVRWLYVGARCPKCKLTGVYGDWKNEFNGYQKLLANV